MGYIKSLIAFIALLVYSFIYEKLLLYLISNGVLNSVNSKYFNIADTIFYIPIFVVLLLFFKRKTSGRKIMLNQILLTCLLAFLFKIIENPIVNIHYILENKNLVVSNNTNQGNDIFQFVLSFLNVVLLTSFMEELLFRKVMLSFFDKKNILFGCIVSSLLFSLYHFSFENITAVKPLIMFFIGIILSLLYIKYGIFYSILFHSFYNFLWLLMSTNKTGFSILLNELNFNYVYWGIVFIGFVLFFYALKKLNLNYKNL